MAKEFQDKRRQGVIPEKETEVDAIETQKEAPDSSIATESEDLIGRGKIGEAIYDDALLNGKEN